MIKKASSSFILDTHIWFWLTNGEEKRLSSKVIETLNQDGSDIYISIISVWEIGMLVAKRRIRLTLSCLEWTYRALQSQKIELADLTPEIAIQSSQLPGNFHGDPADRIIVATAKNLNAVLVTKDKNILSYSKKKHLRAISA